MEATVMLADWAEAINGKLYIQGAGWSRVPAASGPIRCALAIQIAVPWDQTNTEHVLHIRLLDADGNLVTLEDGTPVEIEASFEVGRPPGVAHGTPLDVTLAPNFMGIPLPAGRYRFTLEVDGSPIKGVAFDVL